MDGLVGLGIDLSGSTRHAAFVEEGRVSSLALPLGASQPSVVFDRFGSISSLGVGFPSLIRSLGRTTPVLMGDSRVSVEALLLQQLAATRTALAAKTSTRLGKTALAVPAMLSQRSRKTLLELCARAGLEDVALLDACSAASIGVQPDPDRPTTTLVYHLGYGDFESAVIRTAHGRRKVVCSGVVARVSGEMLEALLLEAVVLALREGRVFLGLKQLTGTQWLELRDIARAARSALAQGPEFVVTLSPHLTLLPASIEVQLLAAGFAAKIAPLLDRTVENVFALLEQGELEPADIGEWLLVGDVACSAPVVEYLERSTGGVVRRTDPDVLAKGAALHAGMLAEQPLPTETPRKGGPNSNGGEGVRSRIAQEASDEASLIARATFASLVRRPSEAPPRGAKPTTPKRRAGSAEAGALEAARDLVEQHRYEEAQASLDAIGKEVHRLQSEVEEHSSMGPRRLIQDAQARLEGGRVEDAVRLTHLAYARAPRDPEVFSGMMRIHMEAGLALDQPEEYETSVRLLICAHHHDQTDRTLHRALAERHFRHAVAMHRLNNAEKALEVVQTTLTYDPQHEGALALLADLTDETVG